MDIISTAKTDADKQMETKPEGRGRTLGIKKLKQQEAMVGGLKKSTQTIVGLVKEVAWSNYIYRNAYTNFMEAAAGMEDMKLLQTIPSGSDENMKIMMEYMAYRRKRGRKLLAVEEEEKQAKGKEGGDDNANGAIVMDDDED